MTRNQRLHPMLVSATLAAILLSAMHAFAASAEPELAARSGTSAAVDAIPTTSPDAATRRPPRRLSSHPFRHSLRMPFFSFQPLG